MRKNLLLPWEHITLETQLSSGEVEERLRKVTDVLQKGDSRFFGYLREKKGDQFRGTIDPGKFELQRIIYYRNSFLPVIHGELTPFVYGTEIKLRFRLSLLVLVFMSVWLGVVFLISCGVIFTWIVTGFYRDPMWIPFAMFLFGYVLTVVAFKIESRIARLRLIDLLEANEKES